VIEISTIIGEPAEGQLTVPGEGSLTRRVTGVPFGATAELYFRYGGTLTCSFLVIPAVVGRIPQTGPGPGWRVCLNARGPDSGY